MSNAFRSVRHALNRIPRVTREDVHGLAVRIPVLEGKRLRGAQDHEREVTALLQAVLEVKQGTFVDVGVNLGQILVKVKAFDPGRAYVGFEASLFCSYYTTRLIELNGFDDCMLVPRGLSNKSGMANLHFSTISDSSATLVEGFWIGKNAKAFSTAVMLDTGDTSLESLGKPQVGIIKVDVEGGELEVLQGFQQTFQTQRPILICEVLPYRLGFESLDDSQRTKFQKQKDRSELVSNLMRGLNYSCYRMCPNGDLAEISDFGLENYDASLANYVFVPNEELELLDRLQAGYRANLSPVTA